MNWWWRYIVCQAPEVCRTQWIWKKWKACCQAQHAVARPWDFFFSLSYSLVYLGSTSLQNISTKKAINRKENPILTVIVLFRSHRFLSSALSFNWKSSLRNSSRSHSHSCVPVAPQMPSRRPPLSLSLSLNSPEGVISLLCHNKGRKYVGGSSFCTDFNVYILTTSAKE